ncbi:MAG: BrnT family toxin [Gammaproteobacteria bacterium]|nr:BrnT family toxin [Gammaproteobacteria bacterium]
MQFEWDGIKAESNKDKHQGVTFDEAVSCFFDPDQIAFYDPDHSDDEDREILIGHSDLGRLLTVSYTLRNDAIRIISARKATHREIEDYARTI